MTMKVRANLARIRPRIIIAGWDHPVEDGWLDIAEADAVAQPDPLVRNRMIEHLGPAAGVNFPSLTEIFTVFDHLGSAVS